MTWLLGLGVALALDGNDVLQLTLADDSVVDGYFHHGDVAEVVVTTAQGPVVVPLMLIQSVQQNGEARPLNLFHADLAEHTELNQLLMEFPPPMPAPGLVFGASLLWAGSGHAMLGDWREFSSYSIVETALIGGMVWAVSEENFPFLIPLVGLDAIFKGWSARDSHRIARRRRTRFLLDPEPLTLGGLP